VKWAKELLFSSQYQLTSKLKVLELTFRNHMTIKILAADVVAQIAAGEVVERPSSAIKELLENSLDAGATFVRISLAGDGRRFFQIADNGCGIRSDEVALAFTRHATSKLSELADLTTIHTLGFRGEALASIAAVSHVTMTTRHIDEGSGTQIQIEGGLVRSHKSIGAASGSIITAEHLFFNTPARLKFLKSENTEKRQILALIMRYAMAYPHVRFLLEQDKQEVFRTSGNGSLLDVLVSVYGLGHTKQMLEINDEQSTHGIHVYGYASSPNLNRADRSRITLFVNGRWIQDSSLTYAVVQAYHTLLMTGRYPLAVLMLTLPPEEIDVNVHPAKTEVRFRDANVIFSALQRAVRRAVIEQAGTAAFSNRAYNNSGTKVISDDSFGLMQGSFNLDLEHPGRHARRQTDYVDIEKANDLPDRLGIPSSPRTLPMLRVVGQINASYIIAEGPAGVYLIDQHAAHERVLYEQFMQAHERAERLTQLVLEPKAMQVSAEEYQVVLENHEAIQLAGFDIEAFGTNAYIVRSVPALLADKDPIELFEGILQELIAGQSPTKQTTENRIVKHVCKRAAVKAGQILSIEQMQGIIRQLERCASPLTCPHGRPTLIHMSNIQLENEFGRRGS
jgi:DNA mismatch repair protein MutL